MLTTACNLAGLLLLVLATGLTAALLAGPAYGVAAAAAALGTVLLLLGRALEVHSP